MKIGGRKKNENPLCFGENQDGFGLGGANQTVSRVWGLGCSVFE